ncbi:uncharacterized protein LOC142182282 [Nicotiana tabacum]|uniref:Uncharacterized protein LOC142182282 n=1 Tax=Nicotiana tabacum TaxID=4097 RepID=A0AC58USV7_TOBAC
MKTPTQVCWLMRKIFDGRNWFGNRNYKVELGKCSKGDKFSIKAAYLSFQPQYQKVHWKNLTMEARHIPRHQFILWLAIRQRLATVDRVERWGINIPKDCVLCSKGTTESLAHMFFECKYARDIWSSLLKWMNENRIPKTWNDEVCWMAKRCRGSREKGQVLAWLVAAIVYHVWSERNARRFQNEKRESQQRIKQISLQLHIRGQSYSTWKKILDSLNSFPS